MLGSRLYRPTSRSGVSKRPPTPAPRRTTQKTADDVFRPAAPAELRVPAPADESPTAGHSTRMLATATINITTATTSL